MRIGGDKKRKKRDREGEKDVEVEEARKSWRPMVAGGVVFREFDEA